MNLGNNVLIIGGSRFVGPYVIDELLQGGHDVTVFNRSRIQQAYSNKVRFIKGDRSNGFPFSERFDVVIDMCAYSGAQTKRAMDRLKFDFFIHVSTAAVYPVRTPPTPVGCIDRDNRWEFNTPSGWSRSARSNGVYRKSEVFPLTEESPIGSWPLWGSYNKGKVECEEVLKKSGVKYASIRPVYILGPKNCCNREHFIYSRIKSGLPIVLPGNGQALVQFVFAEEVAATIAFLAEKQIEGVFNCAGNEAITLEKLVLEMGKIVGFNPVVKYNPAADGEKFVFAEFPFANENLVVSNEKIKKLGIKFIPLLGGLRRDYENYYQYVV